MVALLVFLFVALPLLGFLLWLLLESSFVRIQPGRLGLVLVRGRATDKALGPGPHFVPSFRRMMVEQYPSNELSYRAGARDDEPPDPGSLEHAGPSLRAVLGDRAWVELGYTIRFRVRPEQLREVHDRFGPDGLWAVVRDRSARTIRSHLADPQLGVDALFGPARRALEADAGAAVAEALAAEGFETTLFSLDDVDLGRTGEVIQATVRARHELEQEEAEAATRLARARIDAELEPFVLGAATDAALRYREVDVWRDVAQARAERGGMVAGMAPRSQAAPAAGSAPPAPLSRVEPAPTEAAGT